MLALHFKQLQKRKNSTKDQKCFSVLTGSHEAERTGEVTVKPVSPWRAGQASHQTKLLHMEFSYTHTHTHTPGSTWRKEIPPLPECTVVLSHKSCFLPADYWERPQVNKHDDGLWPIPTRDKSVKSFQGKFRCCLFVRTLSSRQGHQGGHTLTISKNQLNFLISIRIFIFTLISLFQEVGNLLIIGGRKVIFSILTSILVVLILLQLGLQQLVCV